MARSRHPLIRLQGTLAGLTFVQSRTYGPHARLPRGTHKEAGINERLQKNAGAALLVNQTASPLLKEIRACYGFFVQGSLWQRLVGRMFKAASPCLPELLCSLKGTEINENYAFSRLFSSPPLLKASYHRKELRINMEIQRHCVFAKAVEWDSYYCALTVLWLDKGAKRCERASVETEWIEAEDPLPEYELALEKPAWARYYVLLLKVQAAKEKRPVESFAAMGVQIVECGRCSKA